MKKMLLLAALAVTLTTMAQSQSTVNPAEPDTLYMSANWEDAEPAEAAFIGLRTDRDDAPGNITRYYALDDNRLAAVILREPSPADPAKTRLHSETFYYPDGAVQEELHMIYRETTRGNLSCYDRKCFYPNGDLQYSEIYNEKGTTITYYNEKGKKVRKPKQTIAPYMTWPEFPGGQDALVKFLQENVKYPVIAQENGIQGRVLVQFFVAKDGSIEEISILRSGGDVSLDKEAYRVVRAMPRWIPGTCRGRAVRVRYTVPVNFRLQ